MRPLTFSFLPSLPLINLQFGTLVSSVKYVVQNQYLLSGLSSPTTESLISYVVGSPALSLKDITIKCPSRRWAKACGSPAAATVSKVHSEQGGGGLITWEIHERDHSTDARNDSWFSPPCEWLQFYSALSTTPISRFSSPGSSKVRVLKAFLRTAASRCSLLRAEAIQLLRM